MYSIHLANERIRAGEPDEAITLIEANIDTLRNSSRRAAPAYLVDALIGLGNAYFAKGLIPQATTEMENALDAAIIAEYKEVIPLIKANLIEISSFSSGKLGNATEEYSKLREDLKSGQNETKKADFAKRSIEFSVWSGEEVDEKLFNECISDFLQQGRYDTAIATYMSVLNVYVNNKPDLAYRYLTEAVSIVEKNPGIVNRAIALYEIAKFALVLGNEDTALNLLLSAKTIVTDSECELLCQICGDISHVLVAMNDVERAKEYSIKAIDAYTMSKSLDVKKECSLLLQLGEVYHRSPSSRDVYDGILLIENVLVKKALTCTEDSRSLFFAVGGSAAQRCEFNLARTNLRRALELSKDEEKSPILHMLVHLAQNEGDLTTEIKWLQALFKCIFKRGDVEEAATTAAEIASRCNSELSFIKCIKFGTIAGVLRMRLKKWESALTSYRNLAFYCYKAERFELVVAATIRSMRPATFISEFEVYKSTALILRLLQETKDIDWSRVIGLCEREVGMAYKGLEQVMENLYFHELSRNVTAGYFLVFIRQIAIECLFQKRTRQRRKTMCDKIIKFALEIDQRTEGVLKLEQVASNLILSPAIL